MILGLENVGHRFEEHTPLFEGLSLALVPGHVYALTGPSGSGKSTLLSIFAGWLQPHSGKVTWAEVDRISWVFQNPHGAPNRTALDHVVLPYLATGLPRHEAEERALVQLDRFGLSSVARAPFRTLSGGEAQRLMLARGMATSPDLLLIDEPTAQLDRHTAEVVNSTIRSLRSENSIVVVATHDMMTRDGCTDEIDLGAYR